MRLALLSLLAATAAQADDFIVYSPHVLDTQSEVELRGYAYGDARPDFNGGNAAELSISHSFTGWWRPEVYVARYESDPGSGGRDLGFEFENTFQLTQPGNNGPTWVSLPPMSVRSSRISRTRWNSARCSRRRPGASPIA